MVDEDPFAVSAHAHSARVAPPPDAVRPAAFHRGHSWVFLGLLLLATALTFLITSNGLSNGPDKTTRVITTTLLAVSGPLTGAISRGFQGCCLEFSVSLLPYVLPPLLAAFLLQWCWRPRGRIGDAIRVVVWGLAWTAWFLSGIVSFGHALG